MLGIKPGRWTPPVVISRFNGLLANLDDEMNTAMAVRALGADKVKSLMMLIITKNFIVHRIEDTLDLLAQDGLTGWRIKARLFAYLLWQPGILRRIFPAWISYFLPGFHPWKHDDRALIGKASSEFSQAAA